MEDFNELLKMEDETGGSLACRHDMQIFRKQFKLLLYELQFHTMVILSHDTRVGQAMGSRETAWSCVHKFRVDG